MMEDLMESQSEEAAQLGQKILKLLRKQNPERKVAEAALFATLAMVATKGRNHVAAILELSERCQRAAKRVAVHGECH